MVSTANHYTAKPTRDTQQQVLWVRLIRCDIRLWRVGISIQSADTASFHRDATTGLVIPGVIASVFGRSKEDKKQPFQRSASIL